MQRVLGPKEGTKEVMASFPETNEIWADFAHPSRPGKESKGTKWGDGGIQTSFRPKPGGSATLMRVVRHPPSKARSDPPLGGSIQSRCKRGQTSPSTQH